MKHFAKIFALAAALFMAFPAFAQTYTGPCHATSTTRVVGSGCTETVESGGALTVNSGGTLTNNGAQVLAGTADSHGIVFSTSATGNPLTHTTFQNITLASANSGMAIIASAASRAIYPRDITIMASGAPAGGTSIIFKCSSGATLVTIPIAALIDQIPIDAYFVSAAALTRGTALAKGCPSGDAVMISAVGTFTTTTNFFVNIPYVVQ